MLLTQVLILVHHTKVAVFYEKNLPHFKVLVSHLVWNMFNMFDYKIIKSRHSKYQSIQCHFIDNDHTYAQVHPSKLPRRLLNMVMLFCLLSYRSLPFSLLKLKCFD